MNFDIVFMGEALKSAIKYIPVTFQLAGISFLISLLTGITIAIIRVFKVKVLAGVLEILITVLKAVPMVLILYILFFVMTDVFDFLAESLGLAIRSKDLSTNFIGITALSVFGTVIISETIRGAFMAVDYGQYEAGYSIGLTKLQTMRRIILPQSIQVATPVLCNNLIALVKASSITYMITIMDIMNGALKAATKNYAYLEAYIAAAIIYWVICLSIEQLARVLEIRMGRFRKRML